MSDTPTSFDPIIQQITDYVYDYDAPSALALETAYYDLLDSTACAVMALKFPACIKLLGGMVPESTLPGGSRVIGTQYELDPVQAAFNNGTIIRWLDFNDTFLAAEWGHPSDNLGGILATMDYLNRQRNQTFLIQDLLLSMIKAHEIQGVLALKNSFNAVGLDHVILVKVATTAVVTHLLGGTKRQINSAISNAWIDGQSLRTYRHHPNTGSRKSWAAGDASSRGVRLALMALKDEMGYPTALSAKEWGFYDVLFSGKSFQLERPFACYIMENILFKISYPAEFHAQTAVECALRLHNTVKTRLHEIENIHIETQAPALRIISKKGPLNNPADRDHCLEYMIAIALIYGKLTADHYESAIASNPKIDLLRKKMLVRENADFSRDYLDTNKRSIANSIQITFKNKELSERIVIAYPIGHRLRRAEGTPLLLKKFQAGISAHFSSKQAALIFKKTQEKETFLKMPVDQWMNLLTPQTNN